MPCAALRFSIQAKMDFHALRHTTASWLIEAGADIKTVQSIMRHSDIKLTLDRYGHLFPDAEADAVSRVRSAYTQPMRATGTNESAGCSARFSNHETKRCENVQNDATKDQLAGNELTNRFPAKLQGKPSKTLSRPSRIRTYDLRIRNLYRKPHLTNENIG